MLRYIGFNATDGNICNFIVNYDKTMIQGAFVLQIINHKKLASSGTSEVGVGSG
jgi:hypothetical protein